MSSVVFLTRSAAQPTEAMNARRRTLRDDEMAATFDRLRAHHAGRVAQDAHFCAHLAAMNERRSTEYGAPAQLPLWVAGLIGALVGGVVVATFVQAALLFAAPF